MSKRFVALIIVLFFLPATGFCIADYNVGDELNVLAPSGLVLRETASPQGKKLGTVLLGETVTVLPEKFKKVAHTVVEFKGYNIRGFWVKVRHGNREGYVFDGYLSRYKAPGSIESKGAQADFSFAEQYLLAHTERRGERIKLPKIGDNYERYKQVFKNKAEVEVNIEGPDFYQITFEPGLTLEEAYLIGRLLWLEGKETLSIQNGTISAGTGAGIREMVVKNKAGLITLTMDVGD